MTCEGFVHQPGGCSSVKLLGFTCLNRDGKEEEPSNGQAPCRGFFFQKPAKMEIGPSVLEAYAHTAPDAQRGV